MLFDTLAGGGAAGTLCCQEMATDPNGAHASWLGDEKRLLSGSKRALFQRHSRLTLSRVSASRAVAALIQTQK